MQRTNQPTQAGVQGRQCALSGSNAQLIADPIVLFDIDFDAPDVPQSVAFFALLDDETTVRDE